MVSDKSMNARHDKCYRCSMALTIEAGAETNTIMMAHGLTISVTLQVFQVEILPLKGELPSIQFYK